MDRARWLPWFALPVAALLVLCWPAAPADAASIEVTTNAEENGANLGACSLREAVQAANTDLAFGGCTAGSGADEIRFAAGTNGNPIVLTLGQITIDSNVQIVGNGPAATIVDGNAAGRVFQVNAGRTVEMVGLTIRNGIFGGGLGGGGIFNQGMLTVTNSTVSGNTADGGGGILNQGGTLTVMNSTVSGNTAIVGGGIDNNSAVPTTITNSTLSGNSASFGGGIFNNSSTINIANSTLSGNSASSGVGGGIFTTGSNSVINLRATILDTGSTGANCEPGNGMIVSQGSNLSDDTSCTAFFNQPGDQNDVPVLLGALASNGGPTQTHALLDGSPAIDAVVSGCPPPATDQRGVSRPQGPRCDSGAYEAPSPGQLQFNAPTYAIAESGPTATITVTRTGGSEGAVGATVTPSDGTATAPGDYTATALLVSFVDGETGSKTVQVPVVNDLVDEPDETVNLTLGSPTGGASIGTPSTAVLTITDDDTAGVTVTEIGGTAVTEGGATDDTFTVVLTSQPTSEVTVAFSSNPSGQLQPIGNVVFTTANWNTAQTITVRAVDDTVAEGPHSATITPSASSGDLAYNGIAIQTVNVGITDNDTAGIVVNPTGGLLTTEGGGATQFTVRLTSVPTGMVTVPVASGDTTEGTVSPTSLTFQANGTALDPQTVTVTGVDDGVADGDVVYTIGLGPTSSGDSNYQALNPAPVGVTNQDNEGATGIVVSPTSGLVTTEGGGTAQFTVRLSTQPTQPVMIALASSDTTEGTVSPASLTFQADASALVAQTVTVTGVDDLDLDGDVAYTIVVGAASSGDLTYNGQNPPDVAITNREDDSAGTVTFSAAAVQVPENAGSVTLTVERSGPGPAATGTRSAPAGSVPGGSVRLSASPVPTGPTVRPSALLPVTVSYATGTGTGPGAATPGLDFQAVSGTLTFGVNETTKTIVVPILTDSLVEGNETFTVVLSGPTGGAVLGAASTATVTIVDTTAVPASPPSPEAPPASPGDDSADDERVERERETEEERRQRARTNRGNKDDDSVEGDVIETRCDQAWPAVVIANRDGHVEVKLVKDAQSACASIQVGDYLEADGEKQHEGLFHADSVDIKRRR